MRLVIRSLCEKEINMEVHLKSVFERAKEELTHLNYRWVMYVQLFGENSHRIELINKTSSNLLMEFQWLVIDNMILSLSKFTDPAKMCGNFNLSFPYLAQEIEKNDTNNIVPQLEEILTELKESVKNFREIRNKRIAHTDLAVSLDSEDSPLPGVSRADVKLALKLAGDFLNKIELTYFNSQTAYSMVILPLTNDGRSLLIRLQKSLAYDLLEDKGIVERRKWCELGNIDEKKHITKRSS